MKHAFDHSANAISLILAYGQTPVFISFFQQHMSIFQHFWKNQLSMQAKSSGQSIFEPGSKER